MSLLDQLAADLGALHFAQLEGLNAQAERIAHAERLAGRLCSTGVPATAHGRLRPDGSVHIYLRTTATLPRLRNALVRLDIPEAEHIEALTSSELHVGDVPILSYPPIGHPSTVE